MPTLEELLWACSGRSGHRGGAGSSTRARLPLSPHGIDVFGPEHLVVIHDFHELLRGSRWDYPRE